MSSRRFVAIAAVLISQGSLPPGTYAQSLPVPPAPGKSLPAHRGLFRVARRFAAPGVDTVVLRAEAAEQVVVKAMPGTQVVIVSGVPEGEVKGYHPSDPGWRETPPEQMGLDFVAKVYGRTLVVSSYKEILFIHHYYHLGDVELIVPEGTKVVKERRELSGDPSPNLSPPGTPRRPTSEPVPPTSGSTNGTSAL
jgi:hypothetical protein